MQFEQKAGNDNNNNNNNIINNIDDDDNNNNNILSYQVYQSVGTGAHCSKCFWEMALYICICI